MSAARYQWRKIPDGPRLAVATVPTSECVAMTVHVPAGSRDEDGTHAGLAHFVEHMVFKGTQAKSARDLTLALEDAGCQVNACTSEDQTVYEGKGETEALPVLASILAEMVWQPAFPDEEIKLERDVIEEEILMFHESPADHIGDLISRAMWGAHPLGHPISGSLESIRRINRQRLADFRDRHHFRRDLVVAIAGPLPADQVAAIVAPLLPTGLHPAPNRQSFDRATATPGHLAEKRDTAQIQLALAWHAPGRHADERHALRLLSLMLGESAGSRLFLDLREERGLCYQISSDVTLFDETGAIEVHAGLDPKGRDQALEIIRRHTADLAAQGPAPAELERAKRLAISQSKLAFETTASHAAWAGEGLLDFGRIPCPLEWRRRITAVTADEVRTIAQAVFSPREPTIAEIRPHD